MERAELENLVRATSVTEAHGGLIFLRDPHWSAAQRAMFAAVQSKLENRKSKMESGWLCIPTGGSSGGLKFARHDEVTLTAAVAGFCAHFGVNRVNAIDVLPPWHVSGLMARVRCAATDGRHLPWAWKQLEQGDFPEIEAAGRWLISLVPTQLQRLLANPAACDWLRRLHLIFIGGGPVWPALMEAARNATLPLSLSYGMTETAAMVAAQRPGDFAGGDRSSGCGLPHARITVGPEGAIRIGGASLMRGYLGEPDLTGEFVTPDLGAIDDTGRLQVFGRRDEVIISGGEKINLREVEAVLREQNCFADVAVLAVPSEEWGEILVACYVPLSGAAWPEAEINRLLSRHQRPKHRLAFAAADWPRNAQGKLNRATLRAAVSARLHPSG